jgi:hypothetical protein
MRVRISNRRSNTMTFQTEPWGDYVSVEPNGSVEIEVTLSELGAGGR